MLGIKGVWYCLCTFHGGQGEGVTEVEQTKACPELLFCFHIWLNHRAAVQCQQPMESLTAFWNGSLGWFLGWKLWNWPDIHQVMGYERTMISNNYLISLLPWTTLCPAAWGGAAGTQQCQLIYVQLRMHHLMYHCVTLSATLFPLPFCLFYVSL